MSAPPATLFLPTPEGWLAVPRVPDDLLELAERRFDETERRSSGKHSVGNADHRRAGFVAEELFDVLLAGHGIPYRRNGGVDPHPDFDVFGGPVAVKCPGTTAPTQPRQLLPVFDRHLRAGLTYFSFGYEKATGRYLALGTIRGATFLLRGTPFEAGTTVVPGYVAGEDLHAVTIATLTPPAVWLRRRRDTLDRHLEICRELGIRPL